MAEKDGNSVRSPWTRSCKKRRVAETLGPKSNTVGVKRQGRILFKQSKVVRNEVARTVTKSVIEHQRHTHARLNYRSNVAGIVKLVSMANLREPHLKHMRRTPFWIMIEAIHINNLNHNEFRKGDELISKIIRAYDERENAFHIGGASVKLGSSDIRLIFGLQCGKRRLDLSPGQRPVSDFVQRRCRDTSRITSKLVKTLFLEAVNGRTKQDEEDAAKLLALYMCGKLFFANSGETISWAFVRYVNDLNTVRQYDWTGAILTTLMGSIKEFYRTPGKVTGCVVVLLYWMCEHSTILEPQTDNMFPRFLKWDIAALLNKVQGVELCGPVNFEVKVDRLRSLEYEREVMGVDIEVVDDVVADVVDFVGGDDHFVDDVMVGGAGSDMAVRKENIGTGSVNGREERNTNNVHHPSMSEGVIGTEQVHGYTGGQGLAGDNDMKLEEALSAIADLEVQNQKKEEMVASLEVEVAGLNKKLELQAVNIVGGFECVLKMKNDELERLKNENMELRKKVTVLEDQLADRDVHAVTQAFREDHVGKGSSGVEWAGVGGSDVVVCDVSPLRAVAQRVSVVDEVGVQEVTMVGGECDISSSDCEIQGVADVGEVLPGFGKQSSFVRNIKNKVRRARQLPDFEYTLVGRLDKMAGTDKCVMVAGNNCEMDDTVIDVDAVVLPNNKWSGFHINNRLGVWKMMTMEEKTRIKQAYDRHGDGAVMWEDVTNGVSVYFTDVKNLIRQSSIRGNVIDGYAELLKTKQLTMYADDDLADKSYFFSSVCLGMVKNNDVRAVEKYIRKNVAAGREYRFIHFPMCHLAHWTLVVYDTKEGSWKHFNPMRQRGDRSDVHHNQAVVLKECVSNVMKQSLREFGLDEQSIDATFSHPLESVMKCPQQKPESLDCGVIVCAVMRQYVYRCNVERSLQGTNCSVLRANMVKEFINDPLRGLKD